MKTQLPTVALYERLGWRPLEFAALIGIGKSEVWQQIKDGKIPTVSQDGIKIVPRAYAIQMGYISG